MDYQQTTRNEQSSADSYNLKYLGLNLTKCTQDLYPENWRKRKKFRDPYKRRKDDSGCDFPCDWSADFFLDSDTLLLVCMGLQLLPRTAREVFRSESREHCLPNRYRSRWSGLGVNAEAVSKEPGYTLSSRGSLDSPVNALWKKNTMVANRELEWVKTNRASDFILRKTPPSGSQSHRWDLGNGTLGENMGVSLPDLKQTES